MMFLYSIFCQWFSRGCLLNCCLKQQNWQILVVAFLIGIVIGSPIQGYISDKSSRKKALLITISCIIFSMLIMVIGKSIYPKEHYQILLAVASIINGVLGNVFPVAAAAYSEHINDFQKSLRLSFMCRYGALVLPFILRVPHFYGFLIALIINQVALFVIAFKFKDKEFVKE